MLGSLPLELVEEIYSYLPTDDFQTLKSCSLVCRTLATSTRPRLFSTVHVEKSTYLQNVKLFVLSPHLAQYVRKLLIIAYHFSPHSRANMIWLENFMPILQKFRNVVSLTLQLSALNLFPTQAREYIFALAPNLRSLHLERVCFDNFGDLSSLIMRSTQLEALTIHRNGGLILAANSMPQAGHSPVGQILPRRLKHLSIVNGRWKIENALVNDLLVASSPLAVVSLVIPLSLSASSELLMRLDDSPEALNVELDVDIDLESLATTRLLDYLSSTCRLRKLVLTATQEQPDTELELPSRVFVALSQISSQITIPESVKNLIIHITAEQNTSSAAHWWTAIDSVLSEHFGGVDLITVQLRSKRQKSGSKQVAEMTRLVRMDIEEAMAHTARSGRLAVVYECLVGSKWVRGTEEIMEGGQEKGLRRGLSSFLEKIRK